MKPEGRTLTSMHLQVKTSFERCTDFFLSLLLFTIQGEYIPSSCHSTIFYAHESSGDGGARDAGGGETE